MKLPDKRSVVPCNGCTACCRSDLIALHPELGDEPAQYDCETVTNPINGQSVLALRRKPDDGSCIYLGEQGCTIHDRAPAVCRLFDCRAFYLMTLRLGTRQERRQLIKRGLVGQDVMDAGRKRLHTLPGPR